MEATATYREKVMFGLWSMVGLLYCGGIWLSD